MVVVVFPDVELEFFSCGVCVYEFSAAEMIWARCEDSLAAV